MNILHIITSAKKSDSQSLALGNAIVDEIQNAHPDAIVTTRNLSDERFPHIEQIHLTSFFTPVDQRTPELYEAASYSEKAVGELLEADIIVIDAPMYNFGIPSTLKAWIDHIVRQGITFTYEKGYPEGLLLNKKVYLAISSGGVYSEGPAKEFDFTEPYLRTVLGFIGLNDVTAFRAEGTAMPDLKEMALTNALQAVAKFKF
ncbi:FMN-dependent NADH-azoreductase [Flavobacterium beibuense]|uniref:FMN dependent NADH:quinone oxidoreductase n=1 Tax=Flavobacterium beibuense TaxID=657326 RepID=A0A444WEM1_9FLAO|nr:NAD(P)H-dependent oxidoreductase [Flavobacterium beibuense]RYJ44216.1 FMN-dependent NADH-azoreductase [Flavobacterium beibuense]